MGRADAALKADRPTSAADARDLVEAFDWDTWNGKLKDLLAAFVRAIAIEQADRAADEFDLEFDAADPFIERFFTKYVGERITGIDETTRDRIRSVIQDALEGGEAFGSAALGEAVRESVLGAYIFSAARGQLIARTETATAYNHGALLAFDQNGIERVQVSDGDGDEECEEADGQIWPIDRAFAEPLEHPNCVRSFSPVNGDEAADDEE